MKHAPKVVASIVADIALVALGSCLIETSDPLTAMLVIVAAAACFAYGRLVLLE